MPNREPGGASRRDNKKNEFLNQELFDAEEALIAAGELGNEELADEARSRLNQNERGHA